MDNKNNNKKTSLESNGINIENYKDSGGQTIKKLDFGFWFVKNRRFLFIGFISALVLVSIIFYFKFFYSLYEYIKNIPEERRAAQELSSITVTSNPDRAAVPLKPGSVNSFFNNSSYDFVSTVKNPNSNFFAYLDYCFTDGDLELFCSTATLLPEEDKYLISLANKIDKRPSNLKLVLRKVSWSRVDFKKYGDWKKYYFDRSNFVISDIKFSSSVSGGLSSVGNSEISFEIKNDTAFNYWELPISVVLFNSNNVIGVNTYVIYEFMSSESRSVHFSWPDSISNVTKTEIIPNLNILDTDNYIQYR